MATATSNPTTAVDYRGYARLGYVSTAAVFGAFAVWSATAPLDSAAIATARVVVEGDRKPIQHLEGGIIQDILASDAQRVEKGDVLFRFDVTRGRAAADGLRHQLAASRAIEARLVAEMDQAAQINFPADTKESIEVRQILADQQRLFDERRRSGALQVSALDAKINVARDDVQSRELRAAATERQLVSLQAEVQSVSDLARRGFFPLNRLRAMEREVDRLKGERASLQGETTRARSAEGEARQQLMQIEQRRREDSGKELAETRIRINDLRERLAVAEDMVARVEVRAPISGIVIGVKVKTPGAVVQPGSVLAEIVPVGARLVLAARVSPTDVQNVATGQRAEVRFPAFSTKHTPTLTGQVTSVSADIVQDDAGRDPHFAARVVIDPSTLPPDVAAKLMPGMPAEVLIITGARTAFDFLIGPLRDRFATALRER